MVQQAYAAKLRTRHTDGNFTGNYRERNVVSVGVDMITQNEYLTTGGRPLTLMLIHQNGTPDDYLDDSAA